MKKMIQLSVSDPCHEKWETFTQTSKGGYCSSCSKVVIDFTRMSDDEIVRYFIHPINTCGRFRPDQLKSYKEKNIPSIRPGFKLFTTGALFLFLLFTGKQVSAKPSITTTRTEQHPDKLTRQEIFVPEITDHVVRGIVKAKDDKSELQGVNVVVKGTTQGTSTDSDGRFELKNLKEGDVLVFSFIGTITKEYVVRATQNEIIEVEMILSMDITGEVAVTGVYEHQPNRIGKLWTKVKKIF